MIKFLIISLDLIDKLLIMKSVNQLLIVFIATFYSFTIQAQLAEGPFKQLIIRGVTLINGNGAPPIGPVDVVVEGNRIVKVATVGYPGVAINSKRRPVLKEDGKEINAEGMYLLPGFIDMHGHIGGESQGADADYVFKLWLAHGVTTVREPSGRSREWTLDLKKRSAKNGLEKMPKLAQMGLSFLELPQKLWKPH